MGRKPTVSLINKHLRIYELYTFNHPPGTVRMQAKVLEHGAGVAVAVVSHAAGAGLARPGVAERGRGVKGPYGFHGGRA